MNSLLLKFKEKNNTLNPDIKKYLGFHICKYCYEPLYCKHYNLMPNIDEVINHYGVHDDHIDCYICGEYLGTIEDEVEEFTKSGEKKYGIDAKDLEVQSSEYNNNINNINNTNNMLSVYIV